MPEPESPLLERLEEPPRRPLVGLIAAGVLVVAASGGLAWWFSSEDDSRPRNVSTEQLAKAGQRPAALTPTAAPEADVAQVRRAYEQFQVVYADMGRDGLEAFSRDCAGAVGGDPRILDYCLAFDAFAATVSGDTPWFGEADARHVELARSALPPGVEPAQRIADVRRLTRSPSGAPEPLQVAEAQPQAVPSPPASAAPPLASAAPPPPLPSTVPPPAAQRAAAPAPTARPKLERASVRPAAKAAAPARKSANRCRYESTPAARMLCEDAGLRAADRRLKRAYERALAAGVDRETLDRQQAEWRTAQNANAASKDAIARSYEIRIGQLEASAQAAQ
ncbi:hypothetical protein [Phenylobacterium sp.]|uniref:hypothetical protein n=1 Tax=Phenylobacterium sp. TaxID=1871053 RepID=UPI0035AE77C3